MVSLKNRISALETSIGPGEDLPKSVIVSVVRAHRDAPPRTDEEHCIGLLSSYGGPWVKVVRKAGESLHSLDERAGNYQHGMGGIAVWTRVYIDDESEELDDRVAIYQAAQEVSP